jgi:hypothetical protein
MTGREAIQFMAREHPEWLAWVAACCKAQQGKDAGAAISAWDVAHALQRPIRPLGPLVKWEILDHAGDPTRRGHRRYYLVRQGVCEALNAIRPNA